MAPSPGSEENLCFQSTTVPILDYFICTDYAEWWKVSSRKSSPRASSGFGSPEECVSDIIALSGLEGRVNLAGGGGGREEANCDYRSWQDLESDL